VLDRLDEPSRASGPRGLVIASALIPSLLTTFAHEDPKAPSRGCSTTRTISMAAWSAPSPARSWSTTRRPRRRIAPDATRQQWLTGAAERLAETHPERAMRFIAPFSAEPGYDALRNTISERAVPPGR
jgi:hypothetical protein